MPRALKTLLLWLLVAALPLQGAAAVVQAACAAGAHERLHSAVASAQHHDEMAHHAASTASPIPMIHAHAGHAMGHATDHHAHQTHPLASTASLAADDAPGTSHATSSSCSACASCCVGLTAPPLAGPLPMARTTSEAVLFTPPLPLAALLPAGLERPPKRLSA